MKYKVEDVWADNDKLEKELNEKEKAGWDFVCIVRPKGMHYTVLFKRSREPNWGAV